MAIQKQEYHNCKKVFVCTECHGESQSMDFTKDHSFHNSTSDNWNGNLKSYKNIDPNKLPYIKINFPNFKELQLCQQLCHTGHYSSFLTKKHRNL